MDIIQIKEFIKAFGYNPIDGKNNEWNKLYENFNYYITVCFGDDAATSFINYGSSIINDRKQICSFAKDEYAVVLECVDRLITSGISPSKIVLEKKIGKAGGWLDICILNQNESSDIMIECKTYGKKYEEARNILMANQNKKEQLLNYYINDQNARYIALYTSQLSNKKDTVIWENSIIDTSKFVVCKTKLDVYNQWDKTFDFKGIFESDNNNIIYQSDLKELNKFIGEQKSTIYNRFAEILRRHNISDKSNAYNKIFNLFLCKIVDEDEDNDLNGVRFQWKYNETAEDVLLKLNDLYKKGMNNYLKLNISDVTEEEFDRELSRLKTGTFFDDSTLKNMFKKLRLYKNNEFAFKEVIDERTFEENAKVVKEIVKLLSPYKIRYNEKQKYLSEFFERLLNIGIKQESGQFFTPIPIASFICNSLNIEDIINNKIENKDENFLPYVIDYACGSGHFITEIMEKINHTIEQVKYEKLKTKPQRDNYNSWKSSYKWAKEFVYGIEKDYRLVKTTKVATFMNGDGDANIMYADGLDSFNSSNYKGILYSNNNENQENPVFDVVIANPPYSVGSFMMELPNAIKDFSLAKDISLISNDIECLFIERTKQLLKVGGIAGIILPSTILINQSNYERARKFIIKNFEIIAISELGNKTFTAT